MWEESRCASEVNVAELTIHVVTTTDVTTVWKFISFLTARRCVKSDTKKKTEFVRRKMNEILCQPQNEKQKLFRSIVKSPIIQAAD